MFDVALMIALLFTTAPLHAVEGTIVSVNTGSPRQLTVNADRQFQTFDVATSAVVERETTLANSVRPVIGRTDLADLTPGEYVRLEVDGHGHVMRAHAIARVDRARVRSVEGNSIVLDSGTTLTVGSVLRFVDQRGKPADIPTVRPGDVVLVFHHPQTRNIYRVAAEPRLRLRKRTEHSKD